MTIQLDSLEDAKILKVQVNGKLTKEDYEEFVPRAEQLIQQHGKVRILFEMRDFHGWHAGAAWEDLKFGVKHFKDIERIAMVGEKAWQHGMTAFCKPFTVAEVRYFDHTEADQARAWIEAQ
jgi:hypothetical protein